MYPSVSWFAFSITGVVLFIFMILMLSASGLRRNRRFRSLAIAWNRLFVYRVSIFTVAGAFLCALNDWAVLPVVALVWFLFEYTRVAKYRRGVLIWPALATGAFLLAFDFMIENFGYVLGFWSSSNSRCFVLYVPLEVMLACLFGGSAWALLVFQIYKNWRFVTLHSILWSLGGCLGEWYLNLTNLMQYGRGWTFFPHTFLSYLATWLILHETSSFCQKTYERDLAQV
jgi:hypothetical protein